MFNFVVLRERKRFPCRLKDNVYLKIIEVYLLVVVELRFKKFIKFI